MIRKTSSCSIWLASCVVAICLTELGCSRSKPTADDDKHTHEHENSHRTQSLAEAVQLLVDHRNAIRDAIDQGTPDVAHDAIHDVGHLLKSLPEIAADSDLVESEWNTVKLQSDRLMEAFGHIDSAFHTQDSDRTTAYRDVAGTIDDAIDEITKLMSNRK